MQQTANAVHLPFIVTDENILIWTNCVVFFFLGCRKSDYICHGYKWWKARISKHASYYWCTWSKMNKTSTHHLLIIHIKSFNKCTFNTKLSTDCGHVCVSHFRQLNQEVASTKWRLWTETQAREAPSHIISRYDVCWKKISIPNRFLNKFWFWCWPAWHKMILAVFWGKRLNFIHCSFTWMWYRYGLHHKFICVRF